MQPSWKLVAFLVGVLVANIIVETYAYAPTNIINKIQQEKRQKGKQVALTGFQNYVQKLDHFNTQNKATWLQRYVVNDTWWNRESGGPIFVQISGEGPLGLSDVQRLAMSTYAQKHNALQLSLEHRFYSPIAATNPTATLATENLQYLSSQQALADLADFI